jgi:hypothetical protein
MCLQDYLRREHLTRAKPQPRGAAFLNLRVTKSLVLIEGHCRVQPAGGALSGHDLSNDAGQRLFRGVQC